MPTRRLVVEIVGDSASLERSFARAASSSRGFESGLGKASRGALAASLSFKGLGRSLTFASAQFLGGAGIVFAGKQIIDQTSRVQEELEKTDVVFGKNAQQVQAWSKTLAQSFGISQGAALEATGKFGNMLRPLGFGTAAAAKMSERLVTLAADIASFNNAKPEDVLAALTSGLAGQVRPLRQYGVFLSQARIANEAVADGLSKTGKNLSQSTKLWAAYNIIIKDTKNAQGDVARNTESLSVAQSKLTSGIQDTEAGLGEALLPALTDYLNKSALWLNDTKNQERIQRDFTTAIHDTGVVLHDTAAVLKAVTGALGGTKNTVELLGGAFVALKVIKLADTFGGIAGGARTASGEVSVLQSRLLGLRALGTIGVTIAVGVVVSKEAQRFSKFLGGTSFGKAIGAGDTPLPGGLSFEDVERIAKAVKTHQLKAGDLLKAKLLGYSSSEIANAAVKEALSKHMNVGKIGTEFPLIEIPKTLPKTSGLTTSQRNSFFDAAIDRDLGRVQDITAVQGQIGRLQQIADLITKRLATTKDITRRLNLEDKLLDVFREIKSDRAQVAQNVVDALELGVTKAEASGSVTRSLDALAALKAGIEAQIKSVGDSTDLESRLFDVTQRIKAAHEQVFQNRIDLAAFRVTKAEATLGFGDDLKTLADLQNKIKAQIKATGTTLDLQEQLFENTQKLKAAKSSARAASEFKLLGFGPTGEDLVPGKKALKAELGDVRSLISGTILDTSANQGLLKSMGTLLSKALVPEESVRSKMKSLLDDLKGQLDGHLGVLAKFQRTSVAKFADSIPNLTADQKRALEQMFGQIGPTGTAPTRGAAFAGVGAAALRVPASTAPPKSRAVSPRYPSTTYVLNNPQFHGVTDVKSLESQLAKRAGRRAPRRD